jgi:ABC-type uncharacterized transport system permease subunit
MEFITNVLFSTLRVSTPLILAAMAGALSKQVNLLNIALEGLMLIVSCRDIALTPQVSYAL